MIKKYTTENFICKGKTYEQKFFPFSSKPIDEKAPL
jgi:hypothetical protein